MSMRIRIAAALFGLVSITAGAADFPTGAAVPAADEVTQRLSGNVFTVQLADGTSWRLSYKSGGYFFIDTSKGFHGTGDWTAEEGRVCSQLRGRDRNCNDVRIHDGVLHLKRDSGEVIRLIPA